MHSRGGAAAACIAVLVGIAVLAGSDRVRAEEQILSFESDVIVGADGVLDVTETIEVRAEGDRIRRGIYRDFPLTFEDETGRSHRVSFRLLDVTRDGAPEPHHTSSNNRGIRIYAGEENVLLSEGVYTYRFHYTTGRQIRFLPDHTELFWNVTGNAWDFPIREASVRVTLPDGAAPLRWTAYTGSFGERGTDYAGNTLGGGLAVEATRALAPGEGLSVVVEIPDGAVAEPSGLQQLYYNFLDNRRFILGGLGFMGVMIFYLATWNAVGRDPPKGTIIPLFHPPEGFSPALAAYVRQYGWTSGWREFTAAAISLAVKGLLVFDDSGDHVVLSRTSAAAGTLPPGERSILKWVDGRGGRVTIDKASGSSVATALSNFKSAVEKENRHRFFRTNRGYFYFGLVLTLAALGLVLIFGGLRDAEVFLLVVAGFVGVVAGMILVPVVRTLSGPRNVGSTIYVVLNVAVVGFVVSVFVSLIWGAVKTLPDDFARTALVVVIQNSFPFALVGGLAAMNGVFYYLLRAPTAAGREIMDRIEGLDLYIRTAESGRFNLAGAPDLDAQQFERLLPYAIAFGAEKPWSEAFAKAFAAANPGADMAGAYAPAWHGGLGWSGDFGSGVSSAMSSAQGSFASAVPAPSSSSSGFSGGGGSGGGGGGGGGGGW